MFSFVTVHHLIPSLSWNYGEIKTLTKPLSAFWTRGKRLCKAKGRECRVSQVAAQALGGFRATQQQGTKSQPLHIQPVWLRGRPCRLAWLPCCTEWLQPTQTALYSTITQTRTHTAPSLNLDFILISPQSVGVGFKRFDAAWLSCSLHVVLSHYSACPSVRLSSSQISHESNSVLLLMRKYWNCFASLTQIVTPDLSEICVAHI